MFAASIALFQVLSNLSEASASDEEVRFVDAALDPRDKPEKVQLQSVLA